MSVALNLYECDEVCSFCHKVSLMTTPGVFDSRTLICKFCKSAKATGYEHDFLHEEMHRLHSDGEDTVRIFFGRFKA